PAHNPQSAARGQQGHSGQERDGDGPCGDPKEGRRTPEVFVDLALRIGRPTTVGPRQRPRVPRILGVAQRRSVRIVGIARPHGIGSRCMMDVAMSVRRAALLVSPLLLALSPAAQAKGPSPGYHPWAPAQSGPLRLDARDMIAHPERYRSRSIPTEQPDFHALDDLAVS